ncbi:hypothetical protein K439DRAFT_1344180, partial [Ramaria rubella]
NYSVDPKGAKNDLLVQPNCPDFPDALWINVLLNHYTDLDKIHTAYYSLLPDKTVKNIKTHGKWSIAYEALKRAVLFVYPH